jgi:hypothetical protein
MEKTFAGGKYSFITNETQKTLECYAEGVFTLESCRQYDSDFRKEALKCAKKGYFLIVDIRNLKPMNPDQINTGMQQCVANYLSSEYQFRNVYVLKTRSMMAQSEMNKIPNIQGITWVKDKEEAYSLMAGR